MTQPHVPVEGRHELGDFELQSGKVLPRAHIGYAAWGTLNAAGDNAIVYPTWYTGTHHSNAPFIGAGKALDPDRYFIVVPDMFTNGLSTSPSNSAPPYAGMDFPLVTPYDNVAAQYRLLTEHFGVKSLQLAIGSSMSGQQAYHWGAAYPDFVKRICSICGSAKTSAHNWLYLNGYKTIMESAEGWDGGNCATWPPRLLKAMTALGTIMAWSFGLVSCARLPADWSEHARGVRRRRRRLLLWLVAHEYLSPDPDMDGRGYFGSSPLQR